MWIGSFQRLHGHRRLFSFPPPLFGSDRVHGEMTCGLVKPSRDHLLSPQRAGLLRECPKHPLGNVLRQMAVSHHPTRRPIHHRQVPVHQLTKGVLRPVPDVFPQQLMVVHKRNHESVPA